MEKVISAAVANRRFARLLRDVRGGQTYVVTSHGRLVARIVPVNEDRAINSGARSSLLSRLRSQRVLRMSPWKRDEFYS